MDLFSQSISDIKKLRKEDLLSIVLAMKENSSQENIVVNMLQEIKNTIEELKGEVKVLKEENERLKNGHVDSELIANLTKKNDRLDQYIRRNNLEISGIPEIFQAKDKLENKIIDIGKALGVDFSSDDIEACHPLPSKNNLPKKVIVRFANRKIAENVLAKKKKTQDIDFTTLGFPEEVKPFISENLCPNYRFLWGKCRLLKKTGKVRYVWTMKGFVKIRRDDSSPIYVIESMSELKSIFPDFDFE